MGGRIWYEGCGTYGIMKCCAESPTWYYHGEVDAQNKFMGKSFEGPGTDYSRQQGEKLKGKVVEHVLVRTFQSKTFMSRILHRCEHTRYIESRGSSESLHFSSLLAGSFVLHSGLPVSR